MNHPSPNSREAYHFRCRKDRSNLKRRRIWHRNHFPAFLVAIAHFHNKRNDCEAFVPLSRRCQTIRIDKNNRRCGFSLTKKNRNIRTDSFPLTKRSTLTPFTRKSPRESKLSETKGDAHEDEKSTNKEYNWGYDGGSDVYKDLENLEKAILLEDADIKLQHIVLQEQIDYIDKGQRLLIPDVVRFVVVPLAYAYGLFKLSPGKGLLSMIAHTFTKIMDLHFWIVVVGLPMLLNTCKYISRPNTSTYDDLRMEEKLDVVFRNIKVEEIDCDDSVRFQIEYWTSAINGVAVVYALKAVANALLVRATGRGLGGIFPSGAAMLLGASCVQFLARIAAVVSLYQYPEKMFDLERSEFTTPVGFYPTVMLKLVRSMMFLAPLGYASDFSKILSNLPKGSAYPLYASIAVYMYGTWTRMKEAVSSKKNPLDYIQWKPPKPLAKLSYGLSFLVLWRKQLRMMAMGISLFKLKVLFLKLCIHFKSVVWKTMVLSCVASLCFVGPLVHIKAFSKIFQVEHKNNLPAVMDKEAYDRVVKEQPHRAYDMAWRWGLLWRKPRRLIISHSDFSDAVCKFFFLSTLQKARDRELKEYREEKQEYYSLWNMMEREKESLPLEYQDKLVYRGSDEWKPLAMDMLATYHKENYERKTFNDPLGIAVWRGFGIGLGFEFDHFSALKPGEEPSPRRLQARAAKSAVRRYNDLFDAETALIQEIESLDPKDRDYQKLEDFKKAFNEEKRYIAGRLTELVPGYNNFFPEGKEKSGLEGDSGIAKYHMKRYNPRFSQTCRRLLEEGQMILDPDYFKLKPEENYPEISYDVMERNEDKNSNDGSGKDDDENDNDNDGLLDIEYV